MVWNTKQPKLTNITIKNNGLAQKAPKLTNLTIKNNGLGSKTTQINKYNN